MSRSERKEIYLLCGNVGRKGSKKNSTNIPGLSGYDGGQKIGNSRRPPRVVEIQHCVHRVDASKEPQHGQQIQQLAIRSRERYRPWHSRPCCCRRCCTQPSQQFEFLGEAFSLIDPTPTVSHFSKTLRKLSLLDEDSLFVGVPLTKRQLAAVVGLTLFASGSGLEHNDIYKRYHALRFYREQLSFSRSGRALHGWDEPIGPITFQARI